jgi:protein-S-isoprenylcysteine O-methyltransferase Ste14
MVEATENQRKTFRQIAQRIRVPAGFVLAPLLLISAAPTWPSLGVGSGVAVVGLLIRAWASGYLRKNLELATSGPYAHTRNPLYLGTLLLGAGVSIAGGTLWFVALFASLYLAIYIPVMQAEAENLSRLFPEQFIDYSKHVPLLGLRLTPYRSPFSQGGANEEKKYDFAQYLMHREYRALLGILAIVALLVAKMLLG